MINCQYIYFVIFINSLFSLESSAEDILIKMQKRMERINYSFDVESVKNGNKEKAKKFQFFVYWPSSGEILRQVLIKTIDLNRKKPSIFWEHQFRDHSKVRRWMSLPITGKLKDISNKSFRKDEFSFEDIEMTYVEIKGNLNRLHSKQLIDGSDCYVIESIKTNNKGEHLHSKKIWVEVGNNILKKIEFYSSSGRLYRSIDCLGYISLQGISFPSVIKVNNLKSKSSLNIQINNVQINPSINLKQFIPMEQ